jgi:hypothetical protein
MMFKTISLAALIAAWAGASTPAEARLQLSINANGATFSCFDGELGCDASAGANNLLVVDTTVGGAFVQLTLAQSTFGRANELQLSSSNILNQSGAPITITLVASDTNFTPPVVSVENSGSLTFNNALGSGPSTLSFFADPANAQGANPLNAPGILLESVTGTPTSDPDSFSGTRLSPFVSGSPFSMTEAASLNLVGGGSITGFNQAMETNVPEPQTWSMLMLGFGLLALLGVRKRRGARLAI